MPDLDPHGGTETVTVPTHETPTETKTEPTERVSEDKNLLERDGVKYVRAEALHHEREKNQQLSAALGQLEPVLPEFQEFLKTRKERQAATVARTAEPSSDYSPDELEGLAVTRGYYTDDQKPDLARAKQELDILTRIADRRTARSIKPLAEQTARDRADANRLAARSRTFVDGEPLVDQKYVDAAFASVTPDLAADPEVAAMLQIVAVGLQSLDDRKEGRGRSTRREPMHVERGSSRFSAGEGNYSPLEIAAAKARGKSPAEFQKLSAAVNKLDAGVLEEGL
ncbi:MAG: hypothetical protein NUW01_06670 [Gemmatimonadaceae bacterium]|nr:hypothetical protein [Gemmatimonadaceae bacterium]